MSARQFRVGIEQLEGRRLLSVAVLSNGISTPGAVSVAVDPYGAFGYSVTGQATQYGDFTAGNTGVVDRSYVYFGPEQKFLNSDDAANVEGLADGTSSLPTPLPGGSEPDIAFSSTTTQAAVSKFTVSGKDRSGTPYAYEITLTQTLAPIATTDLQRYFPDAPTRYQSTLLQTYQIKNLLATPASFTVDRYLQPQDLSAVSLGGLEASVDGGLTLVAGSGDGSDSVQMRSFGGNAVNFGVQSPGFDGLIVSNGSIPASSSGVLDDDGLGISLSGLTAGFAQERAFSMQGGETVEYTVQTTFSQQPPISLIKLEDPSLVVPGNFDFTGTAFNYDFPKDSNGVLQPLVVQINRLDGSDGAAQVTVSLLAGSTPTGAITVTPTIVNFADGQATAFASIAIDPTLAGVQPTSFQLALSVNDSSGARTTEPGVATVNVNPQSPVFSFYDPATSSSNPTLNATATQVGGSLQVTIYRTGNAVGAASVVVTTANGTATAGVEFGTAGSPDQYSTTVSFADGQRSAVISIPVLAGTQDLSVKTFSLVLSEPAGNNGVLLSPTANVHFNEADASAPFVKTVQPQIVGNSIASVAVVFSEALRGADDISAYSLYTRSGEGAGGTAKLKALPIRSAYFDPRNNALSLVPVKALKFNANYEVVVRPSANVTDLSGNQVNQNPASGVSSFIGYFAHATKISYVDSNGDTVNLKMKSGAFDLLRDSTGNAATVELFGFGPGSVFSGTVKKGKGGDGKTTIGQVINNTSSSIGTHPNITINNIVGGSLT